MRKLTIALFALLITLFSAAACAENQVPTINYAGYADGYIYAITFDGDAKFSMMRMQSDGDALQTIATVKQPAGFVDANIVGDTIYYLQGEKLTKDKRAAMQIRAMQTDGANDRALTDFQDYQMLIASDTHLYAIGNDSTARYSIEPFEQVAQLDSKYMDWLRLMDGHLYGCDEWRQIFRIDVQTGAREALTEPQAGQRLTYWTTANGKIYYVIEEAERLDMSLWRMDGISLESEKLGAAPLDIEWIADSWAYGHRITGDEDESIIDENFYRTNLQTGERQLIGEYQAFCLYQVGEQLLYNDRSTPILLMNLDGSNLRALAD